MNQSNYEQSYDFITSDVNKKYIRKKENQKVIVNKFSDSFMVAFPYSKKSKIAIDRNSGVVYLGTKVGYYCGYPVWTYNPAYKLTKLQVGLLRIASENVYSYNDEFSDLPQLNLDFGKGKTPKYPTFYI